jgi:WXG100 family type VII secretion target
MRTTTRESGVTSGVSQTQAEAAVMEQTAAKFEQVNDSLQTMLNNLMAQLEGLQQTWQGLGGRSFEQVKTQWAQDQRAMSTALAETATAIHSSGQGYTATDSDASSRVANSNRGLQLPL